MRQIRKSRLGKFLRKSGLAVVSTRKVPPTPVGLRKRRRSDTLFVLGSGASINQIRDWDTVASHDSVGFNFWMVHEFVPTFYFFEGNSRYAGYIQQIRAGCEPSDSQLPARLASLARLIAVRAEKYRNVLLFSKQRSGCKAIELFLWRAGLSYRPFVSENFAAPTAAQLAARCTALRKSHFTKSLRFFSQGVASVELNVVLAWQMGYSKVVLCGVDLTNTDYFFYDPSYRHLADEGLVPPNTQLGRTHKTNDPAQAWGGLPVREVLEIYQENLLKEDCRIYVENPDSALADAFPLFTLRDASTSHLQP